jgi:hypothetical protein
MNKTVIIGVVLFVVLLIAGALGYYLVTKDNTTDETTEQTEESTEDSVTDTEENTGPIPFSEVGINIMDAKEEYSKFTFVNGEGTCLDQGFPLDLIYTSENVIKTEDGSYAEDMTMVDFMGYIRFDELPLSTGSASCTIETSSSSDTADVTCEVDEEEVCTAVFDLFAYK